MKKKDKLVFIALAFFSVLISINFIAYGEINDDYSNYLESFDYSAFELIDDNAKKLLNELGISDFDYENISNISLSKILNHIIDTVNNTSQGMLKSGIALISFTLLMSFYSSFSSKLSIDSNSSTIALVSNMIIAVFMVGRLSQTFALCASTIALCSDFSYAFFTAFCIIVATSGGAVTSFSTNTLLLILSQALSIISSSIIMPVVNCFLCVGICSSVNKELNLGSLVSSVKKFITTSISLMSTLFVSVLSIKTAVASKADALGIRSIRFAINSVVPVIGGSISEGLLSIQSYSSLIKTSVGIVGIIAVFSLFLPAIAEVTVWRIVLSLSSLSAQLFKADFTTDTINVFKDTLLILNVILILSMVTTIISIGILIASKTGS